jgi:hypothetical protein
MLVCQLTELQHNKYCILYWQAISAVVLLAARLRLSMHG